MTKWMPWIALAVVVFGGMAWASCAHADPEWDRLQQWARGVVAAHQGVGRAAVATRRRSAGPDGGLAEAAAAVAAWSDAVEQELMTVLGTPGAAIAPALLTATAPAVRALASIAAAGEGGVAGDSALPLLQAFEALRLHLRAAAAGDPDAATALALDGFAAATAVARADAGITHLVGVQCIANLCTELSDEFLRRCDDAALRRLETGLAACADALPPATDHLEWSLARCVQIAAAARTPDDLDLGHVPAWRAWRHGFSVQAYVQDELCATAREVWAALAVADARAPWTARKQALENLDDRLRRRVSPVGIGAAAARTEQQLREAAAQLGQLRLAVAFHLRHALPEVADPFGDGPMRVAVDTADGDVATFTTADGSIRRVVRRRRD